MVSSVTLDFGFLHYWQDSTSEQRDGGPDTQSRELPEMVALFKLF